MSRSYKNNHTNNEILYNGFSGFRFLTHMIAFRVYNTLSDEEESRFIERMDRIFNIWPEYKDSGIKYLLAILTRSKKVDTDNIEEVLTKLGTMNKLNYEEVI